jgi:sugar phosphate isomerase/epimerase
MGGMERDVHVNIPYGMLHESFLNTFISNNLNPEIGFDSEALDRFSPDAMVAVAGRIREAGLVTSIHSPFMDLSPGSTDSEIRAITRKRLNQVVRLIPLFRPKTVVCHTGYDHRRYWHMKEAWVERSLETWIWFAEAMHNEGALLMLENVYEQGPEDILPFFEQLPQDQVGFCLDTGHQNVFSETAMDIWVKSLGPYLKQLHLHDNCGEQDEHLALGKGRIDFVSLFDQLTSEDIRPVVVTLEPHREDELMPSLKYLKKIWPW